MATKRKAKSTGLKKSMYYSGINGNLPPGYSNAKIIAVRKRKNKPELIVTVQMEKVVKL